MQRFNKKESLRNVKKLKAYFEITQINRHHSH